MYNGVSGAVWGWVSNVSLFHSITILDFFHFPSDETSEDDQAKILATSFKSSASDSSANANQIYDLTGGIGHPPTNFTSTNNDVAGSDPESEKVKEDLSMIGKPLYYEDDIEL